MRREEALKEAAQREREMLQKRRLEQVCNTLVFPFAVFDRVYRHLGHHARSPQPYCAALVLVWIDRPRQFIGLTIKLLRRHSPLRTSPLP